MKHFQLNPSSVFSTWHLVWNDIISHLMLKSQQPTAIPKIARYPWKRSYHFQPNPWNKCWMSSLAIWNHPADLICFFPKQQLSYNNCDRCLMIVITTFLDSWDSFFRTDVTADPATWALLIFHIWLKPKPTKETNFLLLKYFPFLLLFPPTALTQNSKNTVKLNIPFLAKY